VGQNRVVILSDKLWQRRFAGSRDVLGQTMKLNDEIYTVIGVMPADFQFPGRAELWTPLAMNLQNWQQRGGHYLSGIGRLKPAITLVSAQADLNAIAARAEAAVSRVQLRLGPPTAQQPSRGRRGPHSPRAVDPDRGRRICPAHRVCEPGQPPAIRVPRRGAARWACAVRWARDADA